MARRSRPTSRKNRAPWNPPPPTTDGPAVEPKPRPTLAAELKAPTVTRAYQCQCGRPVFLRNSQCLACHTPLGYVIDQPGRGAARARTLRGRRARHLHRVRRRRRQGLPPLRQPADAGGLQLDGARAARGRRSGLQHRRAWCPAFACPAASRAPSPTCRSRATASCGASSSWPSAG